MLRLVLLAGLASPTLVGAVDPVVSSEVKFASDDAKAGVPEVFRLAPHTFTAEVALKFDLAQSGIEVLAVTFPSPVKSPDECNNTVHAEYFRPKTAGKHPAVIVLDILQGNQLVARSQALWLAQHDVAALVVYMAYYGPRRPAGGTERMLSPDLAKSVANVKQTVLDCRRATAWLAARPEVNGDRLGVLGTSLGSFIGGVVAAAEPKLSRACLLLGGGGLVDSFAEHPKVGLAVQGLALIGLTRAKLKAIIDPVDPITYAGVLKGKKLLLVAASRDDVVPPAAMTRLWEATAKPKIVWIDATHVGAAVHLFPMMRAVVDHMTK